MTPTQFRAAIKRLGLSARKAGPFLGVDERQGRRWAAGEARIPGAVDKLLRLMISKDISPEEVEELQ